MVSNGFDAVIVVSFGGPEGPDDVMPFLRNVVRGRDVPDERLAVVAEQYHLYGGVSPINELNRQLVTSISKALARKGRPLPLYWGNRNWKPYLAETIAEMRDAGVRNAAAFVTSAYSSFPGCRQYIDDIEAARSAVGAGAPTVVKVQPYFHQSGFVDPFIDGLRVARVEAGPGAPIIMTAHSIPLSLAATCSYEQQLAEVARHVAADAGEADDGWTMAYQSRSGPPSQPWLGPDIADVIRSLPDSTESAIVVPIGFVSDHMEVVHDLDQIAGAIGRARGIRLIRVATPGGDHRFADMAAELVIETEEKLTHGPRQGLAPGEFCGPGCCPAPRREA